MKKSFHTQSIDLAQTVPQVIYHRMSQLCAAGLTPSAADYHEVHRMWLEKGVGFGESWFAISLEAFRLQQKLLVSSANFWRAPWLLPQAMLHASVKHTPAAGERILRRGLAPIHGMVVANAERLSKASTSNTTEPDSSSS